jgi:hypothetical protein
VKVLTAAEQGNGKTTVPEGGCLQRIRQRNV